MSCRADRVHEVKSANTGWSSAARVGAAAASERMMESSSREGEHCERESDELHSNSFGCGWNKPQLADKLRE